MFKYDILTHSCDETWKLTTLADYFESRADKYSDLMSVTQVALTMDVIETDADAELLETYQNFDDELTAYIVSLYDGVIDYNDTNFGDFINAQSSRIILQNQGTTEYEQELRSRFLSIVFDINQTQQTLTQYRVASHWSEYHGAITTNLESESDPAVAEQLQYSAKQMTSVPWFYSVKDIKDRVSDRIEEFCREVGYDPNTSVTLADGYTTLKSLLHGIVQAASCDASDPFVPIGFKSKDDGSDIPNRGFNFGYNLTDVFNDLKANYGSVVAATGALKAWAGDVKTSVSERITRFNDYMSTKLESAYSGLSASINMYRAKINDAKATVDSFVNDFLAMAGITKINETGDIPEIPCDNDMTQVTGASPLPALDFSTAAKAVGSTAKVVGTAVGGIISGIWNFGKQLFSKATEKVTQIFSDPYDIAELEGASKSGLVDGYVYQKKVSLENSQVYFDYDAADVSVAEHLLEVIQDNLKSWTTYHSIFGEYVFRYDDWDDEDLGNSMHRIKFGYTLQLKPKPVNPDTLLSVYGISSPSAYQNISFGLFQDDALNPISLNSFMTWLSRLASTPNLYCTPRDPESVLAYAYSLGVMLLIEIARVSALVNAWECSHYDSTYGDLCPLPDLSLSSNIPYTGFSIRVSPSSVVSTSGFSPTNKTFAAIVTGMSGTNWELTGGYYYYEFTGSGYTETYHPYTHFLDLLTYSLLCHQMDAKRNPLTFSYTPYAYNTNFFSDPQYRIKTDQENQDLATKITTILVAVVAIVIVGTVATKIIKHIRRAKFAKFKGRVGVMDNAMWNGKTLSQKEVKQYYRWSKKCDKIWSKGLGLVPTTAANCSSNGVGNLIDKLNGLTTQTNQLYSKLTGSNPTTTDSPVFGDASGDSMLTMPDRAALILQTIRGN